MIFGWLHVGAQRSGAWSHMIRMHPDLLTFQVFRAITVLEGDPGAEPAVRLYVSSGLGNPQDHPGGAGKCRCHLTVIQQHLMVGWVGG